MTVWQYPLYAAILALRTPNPPVPADENAVVSELKKSIPPNISITASITVSARYMPYSIEA